MIAVTSEIRTQEFALGVHTHMTLPPLCPGVVSVVHNGDHTDTIFSLNLVISPSQAGSSKSDILKTC